MSAIHKSVAMSAIHKSVDKELTICLEPYMLLYPENEYTNCEETEKTDQTKEDDEEDKRERKRQNTMAEIVSI